MRWTRLTERKGEDDKYFRRLKSILVASRRLRDAYASLQKEIACVQGIAAEELKALTNGEKSLRELEKNRHQPMDDSTAMERRLDVVRYQP
jgi:hypothetical protein